MSGLVLVSLAVGGAASAAEPPAAPNTVDYYSADSAQAVFADDGTWIVPAGVTSVGVRVVGGSGSLATNWRAAGGPGSVVSGDLSVVPGEVLTRIVGTNAGLDDGTPGTGYSSGGEGSNNCGRQAGGGGGSSALLAGGVVAVVGAGGGGGGFEGSSAGQTVLAGVGGTADVDNAGAGGGTAGSLGRSGSSDGAAGVSDTLLCVAGAGDGGGGGGAGGPVTEPQAPSGGGTGGGHSSAAVASGGGGGGGVSFIGPTLLDAVIAPDPANIGAPDVSVSYRMRVTVPDGLTFGTILDPPAGDPQAVSVAGCATPGDTSRATVQISASYPVTADPTPVVSVPIALQRVSAPSDEQIVLPLDVATLWLQQNPVPARTSIVVVVRCDQPALGPVTVTFAPSDDASASPAPTDPAMAPIATLPAGPGQGAPDAATTSKATLAATGVGPGLSLTAMLATALLLAGGATLVVARRVSSSRRRSRPRPRTTTVRC